MVKLTPMSILRSDKIILLAALLVLFIGLFQAPEVVLCKEAGGVVALEVPQGKGVCCAQVKGEASTGYVIALPGGGVIEIPMAHCDSCEDYVIQSAFARYRQDTVSPDACPLPVALVAGQLVNYCKSPVYPDIKRETCLSSSLSSHIPSTILRI